MYPQCLSWPSKRPFPPSLACSIILDCPQLSSRRSSTSSTTTPTRTVVGTMYLNGRRTTGPDLLGSARVALRSCHSPSTPTPLLLFGAALSTSSSTVLDTMEPFGHRLPMERNGLR
ncbi:unnamed protein product [Fusarium graminearum]|nr:unnamed protein product [Fusarium graminearum]